jgi:hypothetical protein
MPAFMSIGSSARLPASTAISASVREALRTSTTR